MSRRCIARYSRSTTQCWRTAVTKDGAPLCRLHLKVFLRRQQKAKEEKEGAIEEGAVPQMSLVQIKMYRHMAVKSLDESPRNSRLQRLGEAILELTDELLRIQKLSDKSPKSKK